MIKRFMPLIVAACVGAGAYHAVTHQVLHTNGWQRYLEPELINQLVDRDKACNGLVTIGPTAIGTNKTSCELFTKLSAEQTGVVQLATSPKPPTVLAALWLAQSPLSSPSATISRGGGDCDTGAIRVPGRYRPTVCNAARIHGIDAALLAAQIRQESGFNPKALSNKGAMGIAQITGPTARAWGVNPWDPIASINAMAYHVARDAKTYQRQGINRVPALKLAQAQYNGGPNAAVYFKRRGLVFAYNPKAPRHSFARETAGYVKGIWAAVKSRA
jgi:hypothetical protein